MHALLGLNTAEWKTAAEFALLTCLSHLRALMHHTYVGSGWHAQRTTAFKYVAAATAVIISSHAQPAQLIVTNGFMILLGDKHAVSVRECRSLF